jgi:hypothetical protein
MTAERRQMGLRELVAAALAHRRPSLASNGNLVPYRPDGRPVWSTGAG